MTKEEIRNRIEELKREKGAVILAHYYTTKEVQEIADFLGDSLALGVYYNLCLGVLSLKA